MPACPRFRSRLALVQSLLLSLCWLTGCDQDKTQIGQLELVWGERGVSQGKLQKPRAMAIDERDEIYIVDMTARIQVFDGDGKFLRGWQTPEHENGRPTGLSIGLDGKVLVADTHYYRMLVYSPQGELLSTLGGKPGSEPGEFGLVTDVVQDSEGAYYIAEYGEFDRIQKFTRSGEFQKQWGGHGSEPGQVMRPQKLALDEEQRIWVTDSCNHRIQVFDREGQLLFLWGSPGEALGELYYPYDLALDREGHVYVLEYGNHRVQKFTRDGRSLGSWGHQGRGDGELNTPWAAARDSLGRLHVLDTLNHRVQRVRM